MSVPHDAVDAREPTAEAASSPSSTRCAPRRRASLKSCTGWKIGDGRLDVEMSGGEARSRVSVSASRLGRTLPLCLGGIVSPCSGNCPGWAYNDGAADLPSASVIPDLIADVCAAPAPFRLGLATIPPVLPASYGMTRSRVRSVRLVYVDIASPLSPLPDSLALRGSIKREKGVEVLDRSMGVA